MRSLHTKAEVLAASGDAPVVHYEIGDDVEPAWAHDGATLLVRLTQRGDPDLLGLGPAEPLRTLLDELLPRLPEPLARVSSITVDAAGEAALDGLVTHEPAHWQLMTITTDAGLAPVDVPFTEAGPADHELLRAFLDEHYTSRWTTPGHMDGEVWLVHERDGELLAAGCASLTPSGHTRLGGVTVAGHARGHGLGRALTTALTRIGLVRDGIAVLGLDAGNPAAESLYLDLGYTTAHHWRSAPLRRD